MSFPGNDRAAAIEPPGGKPNAFHVAGVERALARYSGAMAVDTQHAQQGLDRRTLLIGGGVGRRAGRRLGGVAAHLAAQSRSPRPARACSAPGSRSAATAMSLSPCRRRRWGRASTPRCRRSSRTNSARTGARSGSSRRRSIRSTPIRWRAEELFGAALGPLPESLRRDACPAVGLMLTGGSTSIRNFEDELRHAGAAARVLLAKAAAKRWGVDWQGVRHRDGLRRLRAISGCASASSRPRRRTQSAARRRCRSRGGEGPALRPAAAAARCAGQGRRQRQFRRRRPAARHGLRGGPPGPRRRAAAGQGRRSGGGPRAGHARGRRDHRSLGGGGGATIGGRRTARSMRCSRASRRPSAVIDSASIDARARRSARSATATRDREAGDLAARSAAREWSPPNIASALARPRRDRADDRDRGATTTAG